MIKLLNGSDTLVIVLHEIYGINQHMKSICTFLSGENFDVICPNLLKREEPFSYSEDNEAYRYFMEEIGFSHGVEQVKGMLLHYETLYKKVLLVGFSIGATISWLCSEDHQVNGIVGFYGSRIRDYVHIVPQCPVFLVFPQEETSFNVNDVVTQLNKNSIIAHKYQGSHGFCDPFSTNYEAQSANEAMSGMLKFLNEASCR